MTKRKHLGMGDSEKRQTFAEVGQRRSDFVLAGAWMILA